MVVKKHVFLLCEINATIFGTKNEIFLKIIMQWKKSYYIATNVSSRKSATTFGDLPDWSVVFYSANTWQIWVNIYTQKLAFVGTSTTVLWQLYGAVSFVVNKCVIAVYV